MELTFLGTSAGKPTGERNVSAMGLQLSQERGWYLFDCGEGTQHQIQKSHLSIGKIDAVFLTHLHGDHVYGLPGLLGSRKMDNVTRPLTIYGPPGIRRMLETIIEITQLRLDFPFTIVEYAPHQTFTFPKFEIETLPMHHSIACYGFYLREHTIANKLDEAKLRADGLEPSPLYGRLKRGENLVVNKRRYIAAEYMKEPIPGRRLIIAGDNADPEVMGEKLEYLDLLVHECTYTRRDYERLAKKVLHTTAEALAKSAQKHHVKNLIATHISARYNRSAQTTAPLEKELKAHYRGHWCIANDFSRYRLEQGGICKELEVAEVSLNSRQEP